MLETRIILVSVLWRTWEVITKWISEKYEGKSKSKGNFQMKHIYCKYTETKPILLFNVISITSTYSILHYAKPAV